MESTRVDIGAFVKNGKYTSAPGFISVFSLDNETRTYDAQGRIREVRYGRANFVDPRLALAKTWRDVYRYAPDGRLIGWTRHTGDKTETFTADGARVTKADPLGRALVAQTVKYAADRTTKPWSVKVQPGDAILHYTYASDSDLIGRIARTEKR